MENHLAMEALLIERLKTEVPDFLAVLGMADLASMQEAGQPAPAAHVIYQGDSIPGGDSRAGNGAAQVVAQTWLVVVAVRNVRDTKGGAAAREDAGPLISKTLAALSGWAAPGFRPLRRVNAPRPGFNAGYGYFPLAFEAKLITGAA